MGLKTKQLRELTQRKINVHAFEEINSLEQLYQYAKAHTLFTIRFDRFSHIKSLPFYKIDQNEWEAEKSILLLEEIWKEAQKETCTLLCSDGLKYDSIQVCNFVGKISKEGTFSLEFCNQKVPLREMYAYPTTMITGNISQNIDEFLFMQRDKNPIEKKDLESILVWMMQLSLFDRQLEGTLYPIPVGIQRERIVCWQYE